MNKIQKYLKYALPLLFVMYVGCLIAFTHVHIVNGVTIVHSHPYQKSTGDDGEHEHTYAEFQLINQLSTIHISSSAFGLILLSALLFPIIILFSSPVYPVCLRPVTGKPSLRAPPII